eukprot:1811249-Prymnesium_polylepis.1
MPKMSALLLAGWLQMATATDLPTPAVQTDVQKKIFATKNALAKAASEAAEPKLLAWLDENDVRSALKVCCSGVASLSSAELLSRLRSEIRAAELAHAFPVGESTRDTDVTPDLLTKYGFFLNLWQVAIASQSDTSSLTELVDNFN